MTNVSTYLRNDGRWESRIVIGKDENGKRKFRSFYGKTREDAEYKLRLSFQNNDEEYAVTEMTVKQLTAEWLHVMSSRIKESTASNYRMKAEKHIIPAFGDAQCCLLKAKDIYAFVEEKMKQGLSVRYISDILVLFKSIFRYANREYRIKNVLENIIMPKRSKPEAAILLKEQQMKLEQFIKSEQSLTTLGISMSLYLGTRIGEECAFQWKDVDLDKGVITVSKTIQRIQVNDGKNKTKLIITEPKSSHSMREIPIPDCLMSMIRKFKADDDVYILSGCKKPIEPRTMQYRFAKILRNADLPSVHYHSLRHLFATNCVALGFDIKTLSEILGHSSVEVTLNRYVHSSIERKRACMNLVTASA